MLSADEKDYSDYIKHVSNIISVVSLFSGFMFTAYTILITRLPDPNALTAQLTLYILSTFLSIFLFLLGYYLMAVFLCCRTVPPLTRRIARINSLFFATTATAMSVTVMLMSLLWNLIYLALIQAVEGILLVVAVYLFEIKLFQQYRKSKSLE